LTIGYFISSSKLYFFDTQNRKRTRSESLLFSCLNFITSNYKRRKHKNSTLFRFSSIARDAKSVKHLSILFSNLILESQFIFLLNLTRNRKRKLSESSLSSLFDLRTSKIKRSRYKYASIPKIIELESQSFVAFASSIQDKRIRDSQISILFRFDFEISRFKRLQHLYVNIFRELLINTFNIKVYRIINESTTFKFFEYSNILSSQT